MIWLTWRQHRIQALAGAIALGVVSGFLVITHLGIDRFFHSTGLAACLAGGHRDCSNLADTFSSHFHNLQFLIPLFLVVPMLVGLFWGAPLVAREMEQGTNKLVWTQSVTRRRWFTTKVALIAAAGVAGAAAFAGLVSWWSGLFIRVSGERLTPGIFDLRGIVPIAYVLFALGLGVLAGTLIRKTLPAMAVTLGGFIAVRALITIFLRPHYLPSKTVSLPMFGPRQLGMNDWVLHQVTLDRAGLVLGKGGGLDLGALSTRCPGLLPTPQGFPSKLKIVHCLQRLGVHTVTTYQPGNRFWAFQGIESAIYVILAAGLLVAAGWAVRRRLA